MKRWGPATALGLALVLSACGQSPTSPAASASPSTTPSQATPGPSPAGPLFAVLEARHCQAPEPAACESAFNPAHDTVAIAGPDGFAKAKATFTPRTIPAVGNAATVLDLEAVTANGALYFIDGSGVVRRLDSIGSLTTVTTFAIDSSHQSVSFAVSPDGKQLMAAVLTYPIHQASTNPNQPFGTFSGPWRLQIEKATAGSSASILREWTTSTNVAPNDPGGFTNIWLAGWDGTGPIALVGQITATQNAWWSNQRYFAGSLARLKPDGTPGATIGPANCVPYWRPIAGRFVCATLGSTNQSSVLDVVDLSGTVLWTGHPPGGQSGAAYLLDGDFVLAGDGSKLAMDRQLVNLRDGSTVQLASNFQPQGWLDSQTLIGWLPQNGPTPPHLGVLHLNDPQHPEDWGFSGAFVGVL